MKHKKGYLVKAPDGQEYWHRTLQGAGGRVERIDDGWWSKDESGKSRVISCETNEDVTGKAWMKQMKMLQEKHGTR